MRVLTGTSGYSYKEWKGSFYPEDLAAPDMLGYYAERLPTVEINNTFYRMPKREVVQNWAQQVPDGFSFVLKASGRVTHKKRLKDADDELAYIIKNARELGDRLGPMLFQLPPYLKKGADRLAGFLKTLPEDFRAAIEFRHESWFDDEIYELLRGACVALVVSEGEAGELPPMVATAPFGYLRLRKPRYSAGELDTWAERIKAQEWESAHVFFKHEEDGAGPATAADFASRF
ncbi:MAG: DUF72 domain-containing protein [Planctomycetota bacterium]